MTSVAGREHPFDRMLATLSERGLTVGRGCRVGPGRTQVQTRCPNHPDAKASLSIKREDDRVLVRCWAGCRYRQVLDALGWRAADAFLYPPGAQRPAPKVVANYDYVDLSGEVIARKVRYSNKSFRWCRPGSRPDSWVWDLDGVTLTLYRLSELVNVSRVFVCEGEKAVDLLWSVGVPATCAPAGASTWLPEWSQLLRAIGVDELVVLPDNDKPGAAHAEKIAALTFAHLDSALPVRVLALPGLQKGADVFDWLTGEGSTAELIIRAQRAAVWHPGAAQEARAEHRRALNAERQRRWRQRHAIPAIPIPRNAENVLGARVLSYVARNA